MIVLLQVYGGEIVVLCGIIIFVAVCLSLVLGVLAKYLAERNAEKWAKRIAEEGTKSKSNDD